MAPRRRRIRRRRRRRRPRSRASMRMQRAKRAPFPDQYRVSLRYGEQRLRGPGTTVDNYVYRANSVFDPDLTGTGHQPMGFDQLAALYNRYRVTAVKYSITIANLTAEPMQFVIVAKNDTANLISVDQAHELPFSRAITVGGINGGQAVRTISAWVSNRAVTGVSASKYKDNQYAAIVTANPTEAIGLVMRALSLDAATNLNYNITVALTYNTVFYDRITLASS